jgi:hypothetical protein
MNGAERTTHCARCGHGHSSAAWAALPVVQTLAEPDLRDYVVAWPTNATVEVRACARCQSTIARLAVAAEAGPPTRLVRAG